MLVNLDNGQVVATRTSGAEDINLGGNDRHRARHLPLRTDVCRAGTRSGPRRRRLRGTSAVTAPGSDEGAVVYRFDVTPGETVGSLPYATTLRPPAG